MPVIKARNIAWVRLRAPDLDAMEEFLVDFGMTRAARTETALFMRGTGARHHIHVTELGEPGFVGFAYEAASEEDLYCLAALPEASAVENIDEPGGGKRVVLHEPNGYQIEVVFGVETVEPVEAPPAHRGAAGHAKSSGPARIRRIGHGVLATPLVEETIAWFAETLGFLKTDELVMRDPHKLIGGFYRIDAGLEPVDHHVLFVVRNQVAGMHHASFEVEDVNHVFFGHDHLKQTGKYEHVRGISRHALGSQIFDYWVSPWNQMHEHWSSNETFDVNSASHEVAVGPGLQHDHGEAPSERFTKQATP